MIAKQRNSALTDTDRIIIICDDLEVLSKKQCLYANKSRFKKCKCLAFLQGNDAYKEAVATSLLSFSQFEYATQKYFLAKKIHVIDSYINNEGE